MDSSGKENGKAIITEFCGGMNYGLIQSNALLI